MLSSELRAGPHYNRTAVAYDGSLVSRRVSRNRTEYTACVATELLRPDTCLSRSIRDVVTSRAATTRPRTSEEFLAGLVGGVPFAALHSFADSITAARHCLAS